MLNFRLDVHKKEADYKLEIDNLRHHVAYYSKLEQLSKSQKVSIEKLQTLCKDKDKTINSLNIIN